MLHSLARYGPIYSQAQQSLNDVDPFCDGAVYFLLFAAGEWLRAETKLLQTQQ